MQLCVIDWKSYSVINFYRYRL